MAIYLQWYRDKGNGQSAADKLGARQVQDGAWPIAMLDCVDNLAAGEKWAELYANFGVNATTVYTDYAHFTMAELWDKAAMHQRNGDEIRYTNYCLEIDARHRRNDCDDENCPCRDDRHN